MIERPQHTPLVLYVARQKVLDVDIIKRVGFCHET